MKSLLLRWAVSTVALLLVTYVVPGFRVDGIVTALIAAFVIGLVNGTIGLLLKIVTFPLTCMTLGLMLLVINALMLMLAAWLVDGFRIDSFWSALFGAIVLAIANALLGGITKRLTD